MRFVHPGRRGQHPGPDVADVGELEETLDRAVLAERPVQQGEDDVDLAEAAHLAGLLHGQGAVARPERDHDLAALVLTSGVCPAVSSSRAGSPSLSTQCPSRVMPIGMTS